MTAAKHRWFAFSLRTLFLMVTVFGLLSGWLAYHVRWIQQRHELLGRHNPGVSFGHVRQRFENPWGDHEYPGEIVEPPGALWLFGEPGMAHIQISFHPWAPGPLNESELEVVRRANRLFPESQIDCPESDK